MGCGPSSADKSKFISPNGDVIIPNYTYQKGVVIDNAEYRGHVSIQGNPRTFEAMAAKCSAERDSIGIWQRVSGEYVPLYLGGRSWRGTDSFPSGLPNNTVKQVWKKMEAPTVSHGGRRFSYVPCDESAHVWSDRPQYSFYNIPGVLRGLQLHQGPHRLMVGHDLIITMHGGGIAYAGFSAGRDGGLAARFREDGWEDEPAFGLRWSRPPPTNHVWGDIQPLLSKYLPPGATYKRRNTGSDTVMFVVLDPTSWVPEQAAATEPYLSQDDDDDDDEIVDAEPEDLAAEIAGLEGDAEIPIEELRKRMAAFEEEERKMAGAFETEASVLPERESITEGVVLEGEVVAEAPMMEAEPWGEVVSEGEVQLGGGFELEGES